MLNTNKTITENMIKHHHPWHRIKSETDGKICLHAFPTLFCVL